MKPLIKEEDKGATRLGGNKEVVNVESKAIPEENDSKKPIVGKDRNIDLQLDLEKTTDRDGANKLHQHVPKQPPQPGCEKAGSGRFPFQISSPSLVLVPKGLLLTECCSF